MEQSQLVKLTHSVYRILDALPEGDPLKNRGKESALAILESTTKLNQVQGWVPLKNLLSPESQKMLGMLLSEIEVLQQYLLIGKNQGWISQLNHIIITQEYGLLRDFFQKQFFNYPASAIQQMPNPEVALTPVPKPVAIKDAKKQAEGIYSPRQHKILKILGRRQKTQVADLLKELPDITKRTIRRDLDELLKQGHIKRLGQFNGVFYQAIR